MAYTRHGILLGDENDVREEQWGFHNAVVDLPGISSCTAVIIHSGANLYAMHLAKLTQAERVAALCAQVAGRLGAGPATVTFIGFLNFRTPEYPNDGTGFWLPQTKEVVALLGLPADTRRSVCLLENEANIRATLVNGAVTYEQSAPAPAIWAPCARVPL